MSKLIIRGGHSLNGTITPVPNKNSIIKLIPAAVLTQEKVTLHNVPKTSDVMYMLEIWDLLRWSHEWISDSSITLDPSTIDNYVIDPDLSEKMKASVMFSGPLLARFGRVSMPLPQWCKLGARPMDTFIENMVDMGCEYHDDHGSYEIRTDWLRGTNVRQRFPSVTGTENLILMAVTAEGTTTITNAWCEPHTQDLCNMLVSMGADIQWIGSNKLIITGVQKLSGTERTVISDHIDIGGLIGAALMTDGDITIQNAIVPHMKGIIAAYRKLGATIHDDMVADTIHIPAGQKMQISRTLKGTTFDIKALQRPLFPPDLVHTLAVVALKASGTAMFHNLMYEYSRFFVQELAKMKADVIMANPVTIITHGPTTFKPANLVSSDIIQASYWLLLACLAADGTSTLNAITPLFRRFPNIVEQFNALGADIEYVE